MENKLGFLGKHNDTPIFLNMGKIAFISIMMINYAQFSYWKKTNLNQQFKVLIINLN